MQLLWEHCKKELEGKIDRHNYNSYIKPTKQLQYSNNKLSILVPSTYLADWLEKHYLTMIRSIINHQTAAENKITFVVDSAGHKEAHTPAPAQAKKKAAKAKSDASQLKSQHSFETFVVGKCNEFAYASALACAKKPGAKYNPLFLYGGVGLGKTHLMQSIGRYILDKNKGANVLYLSSEYFVNQMISAMQKGQMDRFRKKYRNLDALLVDDIQFIAGKDRSQEEFFHTFNTLFEMGKQIIVSSDQFPKDIKRLEERLKSRFQWGLIADILPPSFETKIAIINKKAELNGYMMPLEVAEYLAQTIKSNIRELEGCMARIIAYASLSGRSVNLQLAQETMDGVYSEAIKHVDVAMIQKVITSYFDLKRYDLKSKSRARKVVVPRQIAMYLCREYTDESLPRIGELFGDRDHSTVIHSHKKIKRELEVNTKLYNDFKAVTKILEL
ncbi:MAG: chromosomal replication initiator protein DnaA [bacterium]|nr:MAG: chromosomal replication initiator protein DnaA [bacterium]